jgi:hypothetical protein
MTIKKSLFRNQQLIQNFFIAPLPILVPCKTKGAVGAVCALLRNCQLGAQLLISVQDVAVNLKGTGGFLQKTAAPLSLMMTYQMSLISAGSISLDSTFKYFIDMTIYISFLWPSFMLT